MPTQAQTFQVDSAGNVMATSFAGDGSGLTGVHTDLQHVIFTMSCDAGELCFAFVNCPANYEVTGGGFFINSSDPAVREQVILHQTYRFSPTQWAIDATNGSASSVNFSALGECARVSTGADLTRPVLQQPTGLPSDLDFSRIFLACPEWDTGLFVNPETLGFAHFCPNHGHALQASGGGAGPIPIPPEKSVQH